MTQAAGPLARVVAAGVYASGSGYPNGAQTLALLERASVATVVDCSLPMPPDRRLWRELRGPLRAALAAFGLLLRNGRSVLRARAIARATRAIVFVRHPPHLALLWFALVPRFLRPQLVVEAYLFAWETLANRHSARRRTIALAREIERHLFAIADRLLVDTDANGRLCASALSIAPGRIASMPLAIAEQRFAEIAPRPPHQERVRVLFVGTFIPLHGIDRLLGAVATIEQAGIEFRFVGDGQEAPLLERFIASNPHRPISWRREWLGDEELADEIAAADICMGVFGGAEKAARVLPFKIYLYACAGRAIVTQRELSLPGVAERPPACFVDAEPRAIAAAIEALARDEPARTRLAAEARAYYRDFLSHRVIAQRWRELLDGLHGAARADS